MTRAARAVDAEPVALVRHWTPSNGEGHRAPHLRRRRRDGLAALQADRQAVDVGVRLAAVVGDAVDEVAVGGAVAVGVHGKSLRFA